jgi:rod shape determining protein RodA
MQWQWRGLFNRSIDRLTQPLDGPLLAILALIITIGCFTLYSAAPTRLASQFINVAVAFTALWLAANISPQQLMRYAVPVYFIGVLLLMSVTLFGEVAHGARRWLHIGVTRVQPSELMKIAMPLMLAWYFNRHEAVLKMRDYLVAAVLLVLPVLLIAKQPDLGTAVLILAAGFYVIFLAGLSWRILAALAVAAVAGARALWPFLHDYQRQRILTLFNPTDDPLGAGYHIIQSTIAVGSGGIIGKGWLHGTQAHLEFIPERSTDFVFAVFSEEFGLIGNLVLLVLYTALIVRGLMIAANAPTFFSRLLAGGITLTFFTYVFVNMGMVSGILPVVGVPLPLISYGGTALVTLCVGFGILMSIQKHRKLVNT